MAMANVIPTDRWLCLSKFGFTSATGLKPDENETDFGGKPMVNVISY
jgi:hypothetical protein